MVKVSTEGVSGWQPTPLLYDKNGNLTKVNRKDDRIASITIEAADDNAKDYLTIGSAFGNEAGEKPAAEYSL